MAPFAGPAIFFAINIEPIRVIRIESEFCDLETAAAARNHKLPEGVHANHALRRKGPPLAVESGGDDLEGPIADCHIRGLGRVNDFWVAAKGGRVECRIDGTLGKTVM